MSVQFGRWNLDGSPVNREYLERASMMIAPYGPEGANSCTRNGASILYRAFHTNKESWSETQPFLLRTGALLTWDGRLDNRTELLSELGCALPRRVPDVEIVAAAYERWKTDALPRLSGDWALSVCDQEERAVVLAKDFLGSRPLYYSFDPSQITWSTS
jgi:asparagine synthase (glutamine-hydrolysing)